jgi:hypothetical protein
VGRCACLLSAGSSQFGTIRPAGPMGDACRDSQSSSVSMASAAAFDVEQFESVSGRRVPSVTRDRKSVFAEWQRNHPDDTVFQFGQCPRRDGMEMEL